MSFLEQIKTITNNLINKSRQKLIAVLTNKPGSVESAEDLEQQIEYLNNNKAIDIHIAKMLKGVLSIRNLRARDLMIPRAHIDYFESDQTLEDVLNAVLENGHSRYPILDDNNDDQEAISLLFTKDLLRVLIDQKVDQVSLTEIAKPIKIIPETKHVTTLLQEFQSSRTHLALVVNEFGEISGLITIEDILEEIVGDISDEFDKEDLFIQQVSKTSFDVLAKTPIYLFNEAFGCELSDQEFDTIGGYVFGLLGHMPIRNESIDLIPGKLIARITQVNERQILKLRVRAIQDYSVKLKKEIAEVTNTEQAAQVVAEANAQAEQAKAQTEQANAQVEQANAQAEQANAQAEQAKAQGEQANAQAEQANAQAEQANAQAEQANAQAEQANAQAEQASAQTEQENAQAEQAKAQAEQVNATATVNPEQAPLTNDKAEQEK
ncbi:hypothetical protein CJP74_01160 [Psittacicella melopsittaci]|uniref:Magnesium and cobalt efflux protein CorC n=1 Tax=Psittacicella melopsittaci TaxID=2028576 RepID=A0A3A1Y7N6_9GAMM|nr:transporter associated domain-containing protein [Psittacicella melopsittaci]RIY33625.1 hypothetical protein CJP74_01160 [Psittacicella melopsittaci]